MRFRSPGSILAAAILAIALVSPSLVPAATAPEPAAPNAANPPDAAASLPPELRAEIDRICRKVLADTAVPSASIAIVRDGRIAYLQAYGDARVAPRTPARPEMRYEIGSISKQFTAAAILLLADEHKLSLDDPVSKFVPGLTRGQDITVRQLLSHTSGYRDYWPQDYVPPIMRAPITADGIMDRWARIPLDFEPGTQWQYSNTNFVIAGRIVESVSGKPMLDFLKERVFVPLSMASVASIDRDRDREGDPLGYLRYALGPPREAPREGKGWLFAAAELAMTAEDLAKWNMALLERRLLTPASYRELETEVQLANGLGTRYGLGVGVSSESGRRILAHGGETSGFTADNVVYPDDKAAVSVLTNQDSADAAAAIARQVGPLLFADGAGSAVAETRARRILEGLQRGRIDRSLFTDNANSYFTDQAIRDFSSSLGPLGRPSQVRQTTQRDRGGMTFRRIEVTFPKRKIQILERDMPDGKIEQYQISAPGE